MPEIQLDVLRATAVHLRHRARVYEEWGFAAKSDRGLGISALDYLYTQAGVSARDWSDIAMRMVSHQIQRDNDGNERGARGGFVSLIRVIQVLDHHGLFHDCQ